MATSKSSNSLLKFAIGGLTAAAVGALLWRARRKQRPHGSQHSATVSHVESKLTSAGIAPNATVRSESKTAKPVIAVDLDEVLGQFLTSLIAFHNEQYNSSLRLEDFHSYQFWEVWGGTKEEAAVKVEAFFLSPHFEDIPVVPGALESLSLLKQHFDFVLVTSRQSKIEPITRAWLDKHFKGIFKDIRSGNHYGQGRRLTKAEMCLEVQAIALIDDNLAYAQECSKVLHKVILFDWNEKYMWNKTKEALPANVHRLKSWTDVQSFLLDHHRQSTNTAVPLASNASAAASAAGR